MTARPSGRADGTRWRLSRVVLVGVLAAAAACGRGGTQAGPTTSSTSRHGSATSIPETSTTTSAGSTTLVPPEDADADPYARPDWLGTVPLPLDPDTGFGVVEPTPRELVDRRFQAPDLFPAPTTATYASSIVAVPDDVLARSTWDPACPVAVDDLRYLQVTFWGFDGRAHTGELLVNEDVAAVVVDAFGRLYEQRFPIEEMRVVRADELDLPPTGDGNNTSAFVCRPVRGATSWSEHAYGHAVDVNPFHNPYVKGDVVLPELASAYVDRAAVRPGMLVDGTPEVAAFTDLGWTWGGAWSSLKDHMHFSLTGR